MADADAEGMGRGYGPGSRRGFFPVCRASRLPKPTREWRVPMHVVQKIAGHSTITITAKYYTHLENDALRAAVERI